jgi:hypothetical protein
VVCTCTPAVPVPQCTLPTLYLHLYLDVVIHVLIIYLYCTYTCKHAVLILLSSPVPAQHLHMQTYCTRTHMSICTLPQSCTKVVPIHCLCIVNPSPVQVQRLYQNINNRNPVLNLYPYPYLYSARTSTVPVHTKYIPLAVSPSTHVVWKRHQPSRHDLLHYRAYGKIYQFRELSVKRHQHLVCQNLQF